MFHSLPTASSPVTVALLLFRPFHTTVGYHTDKPLSSASALTAKSIHSLDTPLPSITIRLLRVKGGGGGTFELENLMCHRCVLRPTFVSAASTADAGSCGLKAKMSGTSSVLTTIRTLPTQSRAPLSFILTRTCKKKSLHGGGGRNPGRRGRGRGQAKFAIVTTIAIAA